MPFTNDIVFTWRTFIDALQVIQLIILIFMLSKVISKSTKKDNIVKDLINKVSLMMSSSFALKNQIETMIDKFDNQNLEYSKNVEKSLKRIDDAMEMMQHEFEMTRDVYKEIGKSNAEKLAEELRTYESAMNEVKESLNQLKGIITDKSTSVSDDILEEDIK